MGLVLGLIAPSEAQAQALLINEFMASNAKTLADEDGDFSDWIELYNPGPAAVDLDGWFLTDDASVLTKWRLPSQVLDSGKYLVIFASGKNRAESGRPLHTSFSLSSAGEYLGLVAPDGATVVDEFAPEFPPQYKDISYGQAGDIPHYFTTATPGAANSGGVIAFAASPKFSHERGFYDQPFDLTMTTATTNAVIRYTTNGLPPTATVGSVYSGAIQINGTTTIRAAAFKDSYRPSNVETHTYIFVGDVIYQATNGVAPPGWPASWGGNAVDYGMDPDVVNSPRYRGTIKNDLKTIPSYSVVMDLKDLFNPTTGIYANARNDGIAWERPTSIELIYPNGQKGFQINGGIRIRGGFSRDGSNPKHAFRFFFRDDYGASELKYPVFGPAGAKSFDNYDLRTFQNYSWSFQGDSRGVFLRDQFSRDTQLAMGQPAERGDFYHLYINGEYWGLYNTAERPEASYGAAYFGGNKDDYDVIKVNADAGYTIGATDGDMGAWTRLWNMAKAGFQSDAAYQKVQGNNPDGTPNPAYENLLDIDNLIDYMLVILYGGNLDAPISNFLGNTSPNNFFAIRNRKGGAGFRFFAHDAEHTLLDVNQDRNGPWPAGGTLDKSNPQWFWQQLQANAEFRLRVADHIHQHFFNEGALTPESAKARFLTRKAEIDRAVVGESARWGDAKRAQPFTRDVEWIAAINNIVTNYFPRRTAITLNQLKTHSLYPAVAAPEFNQHGGNYPAGFQVSLAAPAGTIYYTLDGTDPRLFGGGVSPSALIYAAPFALNGNVTIKARVNSAAGWSALNVARFIRIQTFTELRITEIMYHPAPAPPVPADELEFIELKNVGSVQLDLSGVELTNGISYVFADGTMLDPGKFVVLASNPAAVEQVYPGLQVHGAYHGKLSNGGDTLLLRHADGQPIASLTYSDQPPWPSAADGVGFSIVPTDPSAPGDPNNPANWRASSRAGGSPGADDPEVPITPVVINEVLTHPLLPATDAIELYNPSDAAADIGNWFLTDDRSVPRKFRVPAGTRIPAQGYVVFTGGDFNPAPGQPGSFSLSSAGEEVYLYSGDAAGDLTGYSYGFKFGGAPLDVSFGRYVTSDGLEHYPLQSQNTLGAANSGPRVGPVVLDEIHYQPRPGDDEFIELKNLTDAPVPLFDPLQPEHVWKISGIGYEFPPNVTIPAHGLLLVVGSDPNSFRARNSVDADVQVLGPYPGTLQDRGESLRLEQPQAPLIATNGEAVIPFVVVDEVDYSNAAPWPEAAAGLGPSLERINSSAYGNDPANWRASPGPPSPGIDNLGNRRPSVNAGADQSIVATRFPASASLAALADDDGLPVVPGALAFRWTLVSGPGPVEFANDARLQTAVSLPMVGTYLLRFTASDGFLQATGEVRVVVQRPASEATLVAKGAVWKYFDKGTDPGLDWFKPGFNDQAWASGKAQLGYGDGDEATIVSYGPDINSKYTTTYFRRSFPVANVNGVTALLIHLLRDDGAIVYLNGREVFRSNMPAGAVSFSTFASTTVSGADETTNFFDQTVDPKLLVEGTNTLAVEIHQSNLTSTDISFDLELSGTAQAVNQAPIVSAGTNLTVAWPSSALLSGSVTDDGLPDPPGKPNLLWSALSGPGTVTFANRQLARTTAAFDRAGEYVLQLAATDGALTGSALVTVTVTGGETLAAWKGRFFTAGELTDPSISGDAADPDGDGAANLSEYVSGTDPRDARSCLRIESLQPARGPAGTVIRFPGVAGRSYTLQYRDLLQSGSWQKLQDLPAPATNGAMEAQDTSAGGASRFYRIVTPRQ